MNASFLHHALTVRALPFSPWDVLPVETLAGLGWLSERYSHEPHIHDVEASYSALIQGLASQFAVIRQTLDIQFHVGEGEPYNDSRALFGDVLLQGCLVVLPTGEIPADHPLAAISPWKARYQRTDCLVPMRWNDVFRAVHDVLGHCSHRHSFSPWGELNAFLAHASTFTDAALPALAAETLYQSAWVNYGPHMRRTDGSFPVLGDIDFTPFRNRQFAPQKAFAPMLSEFDSIFQGGLTQ